MDNTISKEYISNNPYEQKMDTVPQYEDICNFGYDSEHENVDYYDLMSEEFAPDAYPSPEPVDIPTDCPPEHVPVPTDCPPEHVPVPTGVALLGGVGILLGAVAIKEIHGLLNNEGGKGDKDDKGGKGDKYDKGGKGDKYDKGGKGSKH